MNASGVSNASFLSLGASRGGSSDAPLPQASPFDRSSAGGSPTDQITSLGRYSTTSAPSQPGLTPVQQGEAARAADVAAKAANTSRGTTRAPTPSTPAHPIQVGSTVNTRRDGTKITTVTIDVRANFRVAGGTLPKGTTAATEARAIERGIERDFSKTYRNPDGSATRYVTDVHMTVGRAAEPGREQFVFVPAGDARLQGGLGIAPGFEKGTIAYISDQAGARTAPHEFGHLAGLRHTAQVSLGCATAPGTSVANLMSQTGCSPTSQQIERSQLQQIFKTPDFR